MAQGQKECVKHSGFSDGPPLLVAPSVYVCVCVCKWSSWSISPGYKMIQIHYHAESIKLLALTLFHDPKSR